MPNAVDVSVSLEEDRSQRAVIGPDGGRLSATGTDGSRFTLLVPADALTDEREITLTPVAAISDYPFGGTPAAVHMEPDGLRFFEPATLRIEDGPSISPDQLIGFGYSGSGADFHLAPTAPDGPAFVLHIWHFSGAGVGQATGQERAAQRARAPGDHQSYVQQELALLLSRERQACLLGLCEDDDTTFTDEFDALLAELVEGWWKDIRRMVTTGETNCAAHKQALAQLIGWERQKELLGLNESDPGADDRGFLELPDGALNASLLKGARNCLMEFYEKCRVEHDLYQAIVLLQVQREAEILGRRPDLGLSGDVDALAAELFDKCLTFELVYEGDILWTPGGGHEVQATVPLVGGGTSTGLPTLIGSAPLEVIDFEWPDPDVSPCSKTVLGPVGDRPFKVEATTLSWSEPSGTEGLSVTQIVLKVDPGTLKHEMVVTCPPPAPVLPPVDYGFLYLVGFFNLHRAENAGGPGNVYLTDITFTSDDILGGELYAEKAYEPSAVDGDTRIEGDIVFELWHRPPEVDPPDPDP